MIRYDQIETLKQPVLHCAKCDTAVFVLPKDVRVTDHILGTIKRSQPIAPQPKPGEFNLPMCRTCGALWELNERHLILKEGERCG